MSTPSRDIVPEGYITLKLALDIYRKRLWSDRLPEDVLLSDNFGAKWSPQVKEKRARQLANAHQADIWDVAEGLKEGRIAALVRPPGASENFVIEPDRWLSFFAERPFLEPVLDQSWHGYEGRIPFLKKNEFLTWVDRALMDRSGDGREFTPSELNVTSLMDAMVSDHSMTPGEAEHLRRHWRIPVAASDLERRREFVAATDPFGGYWTLDQFLNWIMWRRSDRLGDDPILASVAALQQNAKQPRHTLSSAISMAMGIFQRGLVETTWTDANTGRVSPVQKYQFATAGIVHSADGHVVKVPARDGETLAFAGHMNMLRISAVDVLKELPPAVNTNTTYRGPLEPPSPFPAPSPDDDFHDDSLTLGDAALWIASDGGTPFSNSDERADRLDVIGVPRLLAVLARGKVRARGFNRTTKRIEDLDKSLWANVQYDSHELEKDVVRFLDAFEQTESGGTLTKWEHHLNEEPDWSRIEVNGADLREHFPSRTSDSVPDLAQHTPSPSPDKPKGPGRGRRKDTGRDDTVPLAAARSLIKNGTIKIRAVEQAVDDAFPGDARRDSNIKRILRKLAQNKSR